MADPLKRLQTDDALASLLTCWELLRTKHREIPAQAVTVLLYVASHNPCHKQAIEEDLNLTTASCSRMIDTISDGNGRSRVQTPGLGLVTKSSDPGNGRRIMLCLTSNGEELVHQIKSILYG